MSFLFLKEDDPAKTVKEDAVATVELDFADVEEGEEEEGKSRGGGGAPSDDEADEAEDYEDDSE